MGLELRFPYATLINIYLTKLKVPFYLRNLLIYTGSFKTYFNKIYKFCFPKQIKIFYSVSASKNKSVFVFPSKRKYCAVFPSKYKSITEKKYLCFSQTKENIVLFFQTNKNL